MINVTVGGYEYDTESSYRDRESMFGREICPSF